jgi:hypothetical protein
MEKYGTGSIFEPTFELVRISAVFIFGGSRVLFTVHINTVVQLLSIHPNALKGFFTVRFAQVNRSFHTLGLDELDFGGHFNQVLFSLHSFFVLNHG